MKICIILYFCISQNLYASFADTFGASFSTRMIGNMSNFDSDDPSNNYYVPAIMAFSKKVNALFEATSVGPHFKSIDNVVITNANNSNTGTTYGSVRTDYQKFYGAGLHFGLPIGYPEKGTIGTLGVSIYLPIGSIIETNSGSPFLPEYVMYHSRFQRTSIYVNFAHQYSENLAWSLGTIVGFQASADVKTDLSLNGNTFGSWAQAKTKIDPSLGAILSIAYRLPTWNLYFTYQQEMKSNLDAHASGEITNPSTGLFDATIKSEIFYEPHTFRLGTNYPIGKFNLYSGIEYQIWSNYKPPVIQIVKNGGVVASSDDFEKVNVRDTINPRFGFSYKFTDRITSGLGFMYKMTPLNSNFSGSGNSIDSNTYILTTGITYRMIIWSKDVTLGSSLEYHQLQNKVVNKSLNDERGNSGTKLGGPSYEIGGHLLTAALGVKFNF